MSDNNPSVLVLNNINTKPKLLVESITQSSIAKEHGQNRLSQTWKINTKYYTADVDIHIINEHYVRNDDFNQNVKVLIIYLDCNTDSGIEDLNKWHTIENECDPEVKLLVVDDCNDQTKVTLNTITEWCMNHGYELIILQPTTKTTVEDEEEIIKEKYGVDRIIEVLQTCIWPNLEMKDTSSISTNKNMQKQPDTSKEQTNSDVLLDDILAEDDMDDFTELLGKLHMMKESIQSLSGAERKYCAEQVVTAFWKAIGGDDEEIEDL